MAEIPFETLRIALEATRGTAESAPTHLLNLEGTLQPTINVYKVRERRGTLAANYRHVQTRKGATFEGIEGDADVNELPVLLNMCVAPLSLPATPDGATNTRLWSFVRSVTSDNLKTATVWWGDPALNQLRSDFCVIDELEFENNADEEDGVATISLSGMAGFPTKVAAPSATASIAGATLPGQLMQLWIDTNEAIGTTEVNGRLISATHTIRTGITYKHLAGGPTSSLDYAAIGREKVSALTTVLTFEVPDLNQYDQWVASTFLKVRVRHNGSLIETISGEGGDPDLHFYNYVEFDTYGPFEELSWEDNQGSNRTVSLTINGFYDATLGSDMRVAVQNARTSL